MATNQNVKLKNEKIMNTAKLTIVIRTYMVDRYRNNVVKLDIPREAAEIIKKHYQSSPTVVRDSVKASHLGANQSASMTLKIDGEQVCGYENICDDNPIKDVWSFEYK